MTGLPDGDRIHPLLGAYDPKSSHHHPLPWLTRDFAFYGSVGITGLTALLINVVCHLGFQTSCNEVFARSIESFVNSTAAIVLGLGLLRILNAHSFDAVSSWPAYLLFGDALFQWAAMWDPYHVLKGDWATIVPAISFGIKILFIASLWQILAAVYSRSREDAKVMISYRRDEALSITSRIYEHFVAKFSNDRVFRDIDSIPLGIKYRDYIEKVVSTCAVVLVVIGPKWLTMEDKQGNRKLDKPDDLLRLEVSFALAKGISVIPLLVAGATMPSRALLPDDIQEMVEHNGMNISEDPHFKADMEHLIRETQNILAKQGAKRSSRKKNGKDER